MACLWLVTSCLKSKNSRLVQWDCKYSQYRHCTVSPAFVFIHSDSERWAQNIINLMNNFLPSIISSTGWLNCSRSISEPVNCSVNESVAVFYQNSRPESYSSTMTTKCISDMINTVDCVFSDMTVFFLLYLFICLTSPLLLLISDYYDLSYIWLTSEWFCTLLHVFLLITLFCSKKTTKMLI